MPPIATSSLAIAVFASFAMSGCASLDSETVRPAVTLTCHSAQQCVAPVSITCSPSRCTMTIPGDQRVVAANGFDVVWVIAPGSGPYVFKNRSGVFFKQPQAVWDCHAEANDTSFRCKSNRKDGKSYEYGMEFVGPQPVTIPDPWIVNN